MDVNIEVQLHILQVTKAQSVAAGIVVGTVCLLSYCCFCLSVFLLVVHCIRICCCFCFVLLVFLFGWCAVIFCCCCINFTCLPDSHCIP